VAAERAEAICICEEPNGLSYGELDRFSDALATALAQDGVQPGDRIGLLCPNGSPFVVAYLGILKAGATVVPLNLLLSPRELGYILTDSGARGLIHHSAFDEVADAATTGLEMPLRVRIGEGALSGQLPFASLIRGPVRPPSLAGLEPESVAAILYTSGTTGHPKGAMLSHRNLTANAASVAQALGFDPNDRVLVVLPLFHAFAATVGMLTTLLTGGGMVPVARFDPKGVSQVVAASGATVFLGVPSMFGLLLRLDDAAVAAWSKVRICVSGGAAMPAAVMADFERRFGIPVHEGDGPTECSPVTCVNPLVGVRKPGSVGLPVPGVEMRILDSEGRELPDGASGEVCVRGSNVMAGYFNLPDATRAAFHGDWFRTGDLGMRDADGYFYLVDRIKDLIIVNGMNLYPRAIEEVLYAHPAVAEAAVVGDPDPRHGEVPVAHLAFKPGAAATAAELRSWCRARLGRHEVPRRFVFRDALPRNAAGKILKRELRRSGEIERGVTVAEIEINPASLDPAG
jgi:long-chain acyl-CoA synthetase